MISRFSDGDVFRFAKRIPGLAAVAAVALIFAGLTQAQLKPSEIDSTAVRPSMTAYAEIPAGAQSVVSATLGRADEAYRAKSSGQGYATENPANHLSAQYTADGVKIRLQNANLDLEFQGWGYGKPGVKEGQAAVAPLVDANRVEYRRGALTEWYVNGPLGIEQGFTISQAPVASADSQPDALQIALHFRGNLSASIEPGRHALTLRDRRGVETLRYGPLLVYDASGRELESWMEAQDGSVRLRVNTAGARYPIIVDPWVQGAQLTISSEVAGAQPYSVAVSGNTVVVGAPQTTINGNAAQGAAFVFVEPTPGGWTNTSTYAAELYNNSGLPGDNLSWSVGISGNTVVVGAPYATVEGNASEGAAYVFVEPTGGWALEPTPPTYSAELTEATGSAGDSFGWSVGISGSTVAGSSESTVVVGDPFTNTNQGAAYVFVAPLVNNVPTWSSETETAELTAPTGVLENKIGWSVGINESGNTVVVGAPFFPTTGSNEYQGAAYVFVAATPSDWSNTSTYNAKLTASDGATDAFFGLSVGISENTVVAGAPQATIGPNSFQGAAYVFVAATPSDWSTTSTYNAKLTASKGATGDFLGWSVGISGNTVVAAAPDAAVGSTATEGAAYVFVEPTVGGVPTWSSETETQELTEATGNAGDSFGFKVGISGNTIVASAPDVTVSNMNQGAAYVFTQPPPSFTLSASPTSLTVAQGANNTSTITVTPAPGFTGSVTLAVTSTLPSGVSATLNPTSITSPTTTSTLTLAASASATLGGPTAVNITGTSPGLATQTATVNLTVTPAPSFTLSASPASLSVDQGANNTSTITVTPAPGFTGSVTLAASNVPGVTATFSPTSITSPTTTSTLTLAANMSATPGTATVIITGTSPGLALQTTPVSLTVTASYSTSVGTATPASVSPGGSSTATVTLAAGTGYTGNVTLSCTISPVVSGATAPGCGFGNTSPVTVTAAGGSATMTFTTVGPSAALFQRPLPEIKGSMAIARLNPRARPSGTKLQFYALWLPIPGLALIGLGLGSRGSRRKKLLGLLLLGMILASLLILPACGNSSSSHSSGTPAGAYTITITGKDANGVVQIGAAPTVVVTVN